MCFLFQSRYKPLCGRALGKPGLLDWCTCSCCCECDYVLIALVALVGGIRSVICSVISTSCHHHDITCRAVWGTPAHWTLPCLSNSTITRMIMSTANAGTCIACVCGGGGGGGGGGTGHSVMTNICGLQYKVHYPVSTWIFLGVLLRLKVSETKTI